MAMFGRYEDWGLQAVVGAPNNIDKMENFQEQCTLGIWGMPHDDQNFLLGFSDFFGKSDGLETVYKPFYPTKDTIATGFASSISTMSCSTSIAKEVKNEAEECQLVQSPNQEVIKTKGTTLILDQSSSSVLATTYSPKFKQRKNQQKRVITQVKAEDYLSSDMWAWRKYGQKPIKGSPYPRSYYRCSSMKGCQARKQVEQSCTDPEVYIVTYTAEHCHSKPTRRNSLAGTVRNKFPVIPKDLAAVASGSNSPPLALSNHEMSSKSPPMNESSEEELSERNVKQKKLVELEWGYNNSGEPFSISEFLMNDDFFSGLEDLDGADQL